MDENLSRIQKKKVSTDEINKRGTTPSALLRSFSCQRYSKGGIKCGGSGNRLNILGNKRKNSFLFRVNESIG